MAAATVASNAPARPSGGLISVAAIPLTITASTTTYATATGGLPFDLAALLNTVGPLDSDINSGDIFFIVGGSAAGYRASTFAVGTPTYNDTTDSSFRKHLSYATCPCTVRLFKGITEFSDGNCSETITACLFVARGGSLNQ